MAADLLAEVVVVRRTEEGVHNPTNARTVREKSVSKNGMYKSETRYQKGIGACNTTHSMSKLYIRRRRCKRRTGLALDGAPSVAGE